VCVCVWGWKNVRKSRGGEYIVVCVVGIGIGSIIISYLDG